MLPLPCRLVQPFANDFKAACNIEPKYILNFGEEVVRGQPVFMLSVLLRALGPKLRGAASLGPWQVVSAAGAEGEVLLLPNLDGVQGQTMPGATIILTERLTGNEDIPVRVGAGCHHHSGSSTRTLARHQGRTRDAEMEEAVYWNRCRLIPCHVCPAPYRHVDAAGHLVPCRRGSLRC